MQASLARWAVVTFCTLGAVGCQSTKPGWWPGQKPLAYSQSSSTPPNIQQPQQYTQQPQAQGYADANAYNQAAAATTQGYPGGGYQIGSGAPTHDPYGMTASQTAAGANAYNQAYGQPQQPTGGVYPEYHNAANPYAQQGATLGSYPDAQGATGYPPAQGFQQGGANPYGAAQGGYSGVRTADARTNAAPGYNTDSSYDTTNYGAGGTRDPNQFTQPGVSGQPTGAPTDQYPSAGSYQPGNTGYNPPGTTPYQMPNGQYPADPAGAGQVETPYRPGRTGDYAPAGAATTPTTGGYTSPAATGAAGAGYAGAAGYPSTAPAPQVDRYGRPIQDSAMGYDTTMQR